MHIPDGFLSAPVAIACAALSAAAVGAAAGRSRASLGPRAVATAGVTAAFVFAAQMLAFPVAGGTSGHLLGGALAAVLVGPSMAVVVMTAVLAVQCLVFGDGGLLALGANVLDMGVVQPLVGYAIVRLLAPRGPRAWRGPLPIAAVAFASWAATVAAAATCAGELALSRVAAPGLILSAVGGVYALIGVAEGAIGALVIAALMRLRPDVLDRARSAREPARAIIVPGLAAALALALFVSPFACTWPEGLERAMARLGVHPAGARVVAAPLGDYAVPGLGAGAPSTAAAALIGIALVFAASVGLGVWLSPQRAHRQRSAPSLGSVPSVPRPPRA